MIYDQSLVCHGSLKLYIALGSDVQLKLLYLKHNLENFIPSWLCQYENPIQYKFNAIKQF